MPDSRRCYLSRRRNGNYLITAVAPVVKQLFGTEITDLCPKEGDPLAWQIGACEESIEQVFGVRLDHMQVERASIEIKILAEVSHA